MKKILATLLASAMTLSALGGLVACGGGEDTANRITVWAPSEAIKAYEPMIADFKAANPDYAKYDIKFVVKAEGDVRSALSNDPANGADIFFFEAGQVQQMIEAKYLQALDVGTSTAMTDAIKERDSEGSVAPILNDKGIAMAFPATADNGWFLWYDSDVFSEDDVKSLDKMLEVAETKNKKIMMNYGSAWYSSAFWFALGCKSDYDAAGTAGTYEIDFDTTVEGKAASAAVQRYLSSGLIVKSSSDNALNDEICDGMATGDIGAGFCGTWIANTMKEKYEAAEKDYSKVKQTKAPTITATVNGQESEYQLRSFVGYKYCGVNSNKKDADKIQASIAFANWMTNENGQAKRFEVTESGPSNKKVAESDAVKANTALAALAEQNIYGYTQMKQPGEFWTQIASFCDGCFTGGADGVTASNVEEMIKKCCDAIRAKEAE